MTPAAIYTPSLHDALPIFRTFFGRLALSVDEFSPHVCPAVRELEAVTAFAQRFVDAVVVAHDRAGVITEQVARGLRRSEEHTSELQSLAYLVCRLLLEKKR